MDTDEEPSGVSLSSETKTGRVDGCISCVVVGLKVGHYCMPIHKPFREQRHETLGSVLFSLHDFTHVLPSKMTKAARVEQPSLVFCVLNFMMLAHISTTFFAESSI